MIEANGLRFHVRDEGSGSPVIMLHGFPDTGDLWRNQIPALVGGGFRTIVPDLRGRGRSERPETVEAYRLTNIVNDVTGILDALDVPRANVVGHDWGAVVAWLVAALAPDRVDRLVVLSVGMPGAVTRATLDALQKGWYRILILFEGISDDLLQRDNWYLLRELLHGAADTDAYIKILSEPAALRAGLNWYRANLSPESIVFSQLRLPMVAARTLGIWSSGDLYLTEEAMTRSKDRVTGGWRYERFEGSHWIPLDQAERLNALLLEFLS
ncbi:MAG TPA: alpha/beta hydrolase [Candidatus Acidoferrum sp.]|nr:alpha/beta hydrolase [Candidatus Acidoferrum sp.]